jgi:hypothetical protein
LQKSEQQNKSNRDIFKHKSNILVLCKEDAFYNAKFYTYLKDGEQKLKEKNLSKQVLPSLKIDYFTRKSSSEYSIGDLNYTEHKRELGTMDYVVKRGSNCNVSLKSSIDKNSKFTLPRKSDFTKDRNFFKNDLSMRIQKVRYL